jgi:hypothetical protein
MIGSINRKPSSAVLRDGCRRGVLLAALLPRIWDPKTQALFAAVMSFWFGQRALSMLRKGKARTSLRA